MKRALLVLLALVVIVAIGLGLYFFFHKQAPPISPSAVGPEAVATDFYSWYIPKYIEGPVGRVPFASTNEFKTTAAQWLTSNFINHWQDIVNNTELDPALLTQDYQESWLTNVRAAIQTQTATNSTVVVTLGLAAPQVHQLIVHEVNENGAWKIDSVTSTEL